MDIRRRVPLGVVVIWYLASQGASKSLDVVWISPAGGTVYSPGNTIVAKWSSSSVLVSPGFKLCAVSGSGAEKGMSSAGLIDRRKDKEENEDGSGKCGVAIWPQVRQAEDGYMVSITAPEAAEMSEYCLEMQDDFGNVFTSPVFGLGGDLSKKATSTDPVTSAAPITTASSETSKTLVDTARRSATLSSTGSIPSVSNNTTASPPRLGIPAPSAQSLPSTQPDILVSRRPVSTAAIAVPLSVVSGIILVAGLLGWRTMRALAKDRKRELKSLILSQKDSRDEGYGSVGEVQRAISALSSRKGCTTYSNTPDALPLFMTKPEPRPVTRDPYPLMTASVSSGSVYDLPMLQYAGTQGVGRGKSLTAQYTASGTVPPPESVSSSQSMSFSTTTSGIPSALLPAPLSPLHVRSETPGGERPLPMPPCPISCLSPSGSTNVYDVIAAKLKGHQ